MSEISKLRNGMQEDTPAKATVAVRRADGTVEYHRWKVVMIDGKAALQCEKALTLNPGEEVSITADEANGPNPTKAELEARLNDERQHHAAQNLDAHAARFEEGELLIRCARDWADEPENWDKENENRTFRSIRLAAERVIEKRLAGK